MEGWNIYPLYTDRPIVAHIIISMEIEIDDLACQGTGISIWGDSRYGNSLIRGTSDLICICIYRTRGWIIFLLLVISCSTYGRFLWKCTIDDPVLGRENPVPGTHIFIFCRLGIIPIGQNGQ